MVVVLGILLMKVTQMTMNYHHAIGYHYFKMLKKTNAQIEEIHIYLNMNIVLLYFRCLSINYLIDTLSFSISSESF